MSKFVRSIPLGIASAGDAENDFTIIPLAPEVTIALGISASVSIRTEQDEERGLMTFVAIKNGAGCCGSITLPSREGWEQEAIVDFASHVLVESKSVPNMFKIARDFSGSLWITTPAGTLAICDSDAGSLGFSIEMHVGDNIMEEPQFSIDI